MRSEKESSLQYQNLLLNIVHSPRQCDHLVLGRRCRREWRDEGEGGGLCSGFQSASHLVKGYVLQCWLQVVKESGAKWRAMSNSCIPGYLKGRSAPKKEILDNESLCKQVGHERKRAEASEEKVEKITEMCPTLHNENEDIKRKMGYVLEQLAYFTCAQLPEEFEVAVVLSDVNLLVEYAKKMSRFLGF
ncbi:hypothetical protein Tco_0751938 [Tanacetum coccineum]|uniref:Uncharacterized protein n=1 Tax=Tanacetum coccineum TaxID=301880 RepID=A0ABQ4Z6B8_9ASTR